MCVKHLLVEFAVPMVFGCILDAYGAFSAAFFAIAALVFGGCWLADCIVCCTLEDVVSLFCKDFSPGLTLWEDSPRGVTPRKDSLRGFFCDKSPWGLFFLQTLPTQSVLFHFRHPQSC